MSSMPVQATAISPGRGDGSARRTSRAREEPKPWRPSWALTLARQPRGSASHCDAQAVSRAILRVNEVVGRTSGAFKKHSQRVTNSQRQVRVRAHVTVCVREREREIER